MIGAMKRTPPLAPAPARSLLRSLGFALSLARGLALCLPLRLALCLALCLALGLGAAGCGVSRSEGDLGLAAFGLRNCGGFLNDVAGCDIKARLATGGKVDARATRLSDGTLLSLESDLPGVLEVVHNGSYDYTLVGQSAGRATLSARLNNTEIDHVTVQVDDAAQLAFITQSANAGTFSLRPNGDVDGTYVLNKTVQRFTILFAQLDNAQQKMLGRESFTTELQPGLEFYPGSQNPTVMQFDLQRPKTPGTYALTVKQKIGPARFKLLITAE